MHTDQSWLKNARKTVAKWLSPSTPESDARMAAAVRLTAMFDEKPSTEQSKYAKSTQIGIKAEVTFKPGDFGSEDLAAIFSKEGERDRCLSLYAKSADELNALIVDGWVLVSVTNSPHRSITAHGSQRVYKSFKPNKAILVETVHATYGGSGVPYLTISETVEDAADALLYMAFSGAENCFPNAPSEEFGIAGPVFGSKSANNEINWPTVNGGIDVSLGFIVERSVLSRARGPLPAGYDPVPRYVKVVLRMSLLGPSL